MTVQQNWRRTAAGFRSRWRIPARRVASKSRDQRRRIDDLSAFINLIGHRNLLRSLGPCSATSTPHKESPWPLTEPPTIRFPGMVPGSTMEAKMSWTIDRRSCIGGSDARVIMGDDEAALVRLWREKRGEVEPEDLTDNLIVQLGTVTEDLNRRWYERNTGLAIKDVQRRLQHPVIKWMAATLDGLVDPGGAVFEAKFMLPWTFSEEAAAEKHMAQLQHNMWVSSARSAVLSIITGRRQMGRALDPRRSAVPAPLADRGEEVLALRPERRGASAVRGRAATAAAGGSPHRRHECLELMGGVCRRVPAHPASLCRT